MADKTPSLAQCLDKMKPHCSLRIWQESADFMGDCHLAPGRTMTSAPQVQHRNDAARRFDCPAFLVPQKPARQSTATENLDGDALNGRF
jgi:hypothetical protein